MWDGITCGGTCVRPGLVLLKQDVIIFWPLPRDALFETFRVLIKCSEFTVAPFSRKSMSTTPSEFQNTVNMTFPAEALVLNFFGAGDPFWRYSIDCLLFSGS
jgi:hypothetical protein